MSMFDPDTFMSSSTTEASETRIEPVPEGDYPAVIGGDEGDVKVRQFNSARTGDTYTSLDVTWEIQDAQLAVQLGRKTLRVRQSIFLDLNESGGLAMGPGKNVSLGRLRDALGQNRPGQPWSPANLRGAGPALIKVKHRMVEEDVYDEVKGVAKLS